MVKRNKIIKLFILVIVLILATLMYFTVLKLNKQKQEEEQNTQVTLETIGEMNPDDITSFSYTYEGAFYEFYKEEENWKSSNDKQLELDQDKVIDLVNKFKNVSANRLVEENAKDLKQYGLDTPKDVISATDINGNTIVYEIGNQNQTVNGFYIKKQENNTVYLIETLPNLFHKTLDDLKLQEDVNTENTQTQD